LFILIKPTGTRGLKFRFTISISGNPLLSVALLLSGLYRSDNQRERQRRNPQAMTTAIAIAAGRN
jgi:hypothetical protein